MLLANVELVGRRLASVPDFVELGSKKAMRVNPELDPDVDDEAPAAAEITAYDELHFVTYLRLLDAKADGADWRVAAQVVLHRDTVRDHGKSRRCWESHLARAEWIAERGYRLLLEQAVLQVGGELGRNKD